MNAPIMPHSWTLPPMSSSPSTHEWGPGRGRTACHRPPPRGPRAPGRSWAAVRTADQDYGWLTGVVGESSSTPAPWLIYVSPPPGGMTLSPSLRGGGVRGPQLDCIFEAFLAEGPPGSTTSSGWKSAVAKTPRPPIGEMPSGHRRPPSPTTMNPSVRSAPLPLPASLPSRKSPLL